MTIEELSVKEILYNLITSDFKGMKFKEQLLLHLLQSQVKKDEAIRQLSMKS